MWWTIHCALSIWTGNIFTLISSMQQSCFFSPQVTEAETFTPKSFHSDYLHAETSLWVTCVLKKRQERCMSFSARVGFLLLLTVDRISRETRRDEKTQRDRRGPGSDLVERCYIDALDLKQIKVFTWVISNVNGVYVVVIYASLCL